MSRNPFGYDDIFKCPAESFHEQTLPHLGSNSDEVSDDVASRPPVVTEPRSVVGPTQVNSKLLVSVGKGKETVIVVEEVLVCSMRALDFSVVSGGGDTDQLVADTVALQGDIESTGLV